MPDPREVKDEMKDEIGYRPKKLYGEDGGASLWLGDKALQATTPKGYKDILIVGHAM